MYEKFYVHEIAAVDLSKIYFLKNAKKTCKPNNRDLNRHWISCCVYLDGADKNSSYSKVATRRYSTKKLLKILALPATLIKIAGVFLWILLEFSEQHFYGRTAAKSLLNSVGSVGWWVAWVKFWREWRG